MYCELNNAYHTLNNWSDLSITENNSHMKENMENTHPTQNLEGKWPKDVFTAQGNFIPYVDNQSNMVSNAQVNNLPDSFAQISQTDLTNKSAKIGGTMIDSLPHEKSGQYRQLNNTMHGTVYRGDNKMFEKHKRKDEFSRILSSDLYFEDIKLVIFLIFIGLFIFFLLDILVRLSYKLL